MTKPCPVEGCWERIPERRALCPACTAWWHRLQMLDANGLAAYLGKLARFAGRHYYRSRRAGMLRRQRAA